MTDPRNVAHDKKVQQEKKHKGEEAVADASATPQPGKKPHLIHHASDSKPADPDGTPGDTPDH